MVLSQKHYSISTGWKVCFYITLDTGEFHLHSRPWHPHKVSRAFYRGVFQKQCVCTGPILADLSLTDFYCPQFPVEENAIYSKINFFFLLCATFLPRFMGAGIQRDNHRTKPSVSHYSLQHISSQCTTEQHLRLILCRLPFLLDHSKLLMWTHNYLPK